MAQLQSGHPGSRLRWRGGSCLAEVAREVNPSVGRKHSFRHILCRWSARFSCTQRESTTTTLQSLCGIAVERVCFSSLPLAPEFASRPPLSGFWNLGWLQLYTAHLADVTNYL